MITTWTMVPAPTTGYSKKMHSWKEPHVDR